MSDTPSKNVGLYRLCLEAGTGAAGAKTLHLELLVNAVTGEVTGQGKQTQAVQPPGGEIQISNVKGIVHGAGIPPVTKLLSVEGEAFVSFPPPAIGSYLAPFRATFAIDNNWSGKGSWTIGREEPNEAPVKSVPCE